MTTTDFLKNASKVTLVLSLLFILDFILPNLSYETTISDVYRPLRKQSGKYSESRRQPSKDEVLIKTEKGRIKLLVQDALPTSKGDQVKLYKTFIFRYGRKIYHTKHDKMISTGNFIYSWFAFLPFVILISSWFTLKLKSRSDIENIGGATVAITIFTLYLLIEEFLL